MLLRILLILATFFLQNAYGQTLNVRSAATPNASPFMADANGQPLYWGSKYVADGSPYFHDNYNWADITVMSGKVYKDVRVKFNVMECNVQYVLDDGTEMIATTPVKSIRFQNLPTEAGMHVITLRSDTGALNTNSKSAVYQLLDSGKVSLLKKITISYRDEKKYGEAVTTRHFDRREVDYIFLEGNEMKKLEKSRSFITGLLKDKSKEVNAFIEKNNIKCKSLKEIRMVVEYYNSL